MVFHLSSSFCKSVYLIKEYKEHTSQLNLNACRCTNCKERNQSKKKYCSENWYDHKKIREHKNGNFFPPLPELAAFWLNNEDMH